MQPPPFHSTDTSNVTFDIDDEIERLERELQQLDDDDDVGEANDDSCDDDDVDNNDGHGNHSQETHTQVMILSLSESNQTPIEKLPTHCLPEHNNNTVSTTNKKRKKKNTTTTIRNGLDTDQYHRNTSTTATTLGKHKKLKVAEETEAADVKTTAQHHPSMLLSGGLKQAVRELIQTYQPKSSERLPFYCRYCQSQSNNYTTFVQHQTLVSHTHNVTLHNKASYCQLCHKQLTSPTQLKEHLQSKPHCDKLKYVQSKQQAQQQQNNKKKTLST
jgi:Zinc-finger of C2H2 type